MVLAEADIHPDDLPEKSGAGLLRSGRKRASAQSLAYPKGTASTIAPRLVKTPPMRPVVGTPFRRPFRDAMTLPADPKAPFFGQFTFEQTLSETTKSRYRGKVVMLIDARAFQNLGKRQLSP